jgi:hypothetical protein
VARPRRGSTSNVDLSAAQTVRRFLEELSGKGVSVVFGRVIRHRIAELIGEGLFATLHEALEAIRAEGAQV